MLNIAPIKTEEDYEAALSRLADIFQAETGTPEGDERDVLCDLVELYEGKHFPIPLPDPISAIRFRMEQANLTQRDLSPFIGSRAKVSEVLSGKRPITMSMARALHQHLGVPADVLLQEPGESLPDGEPAVEWSRFPLKAMAKAGWIPNASNLLDRAEEAITDLMDRAGGRTLVGAQLYRKNDYRRINAKADEYSLWAWCLHVMAKARERDLNIQYRIGTVTPEFLREVAQLSMSENGPREAMNFLIHHGIGFEFVPHLPRTHLDGAALRLGDGRPVVGLTLRYDRIDNFWFTLLHELAHIGLHLDPSESELAFLDDHSLRGIEAVGGDSMEQDADRWAQDALIPPEVWEKGAILDHPTPMSVLDVGWDAGVHPAIIAGRIRHEKGNFRLLSQFVGAGEVRRQFQIEPSGLPA